MQHIYGLFGFDFQLELSTRPDNFLGDIETWNQAEAVSLHAPTFTFDAGVNYIFNLYSN